jgi:hypothetical protein
MLVSIYPFSALGMCTYMRAGLLLLDKRRVFKGSSLICISYLIFLRSVAGIWCRGRFPEGMGN